MWSASGRGVKRLVKIRYQCSGPLCGASRSANCVNERDIHLLTRFFGGHREKRRSFYAARALPSERDRRLPQLWRPCLHWQCDNQYHKLLQRSKEGEKETSPSRKVKEITQNPCSAPVHPTRGKIKNKNTTSYLKMTGGRSLT